MASLTGGDAVIVLAKQEDVKVIKTMGDAAYSPYIERLDGKLPAPMNADYSKIVDTKELYVLKVDDETIGAMRISKAHGDDESIMVDDLVVDPTKQSRGYGRVMMIFAENKAQEVGSKAITLYTNEKMFENINFYKGTGFIEVERKVQDGYSRVFFKKSIG